MTVLPSAPPIAAPAPTREPHATSNKLAVTSVAVVGLGYVGLPTALALVDTGVQVTGIDISEERLGDIRSGRVDLIPADIARLDRVLADDGVTLTSDTAALTAADAVLICVPTPVDRHLTPDLEALRSACETVVAHARAGQVIILTSTSYIGTTEDLLAKPLRKKGMRIGVDVFVAFSPERIDPGNVTVTQEMVPRVVGGVTLDCTQYAGDVIKLVAPVVHLVTSPNAAEFAKLFENTYRAVNIALANEMADVAQKLDLDIMEVITAAETKPYGFSAFYPGPGIGGHCIPCDPHYLLWHLRAERGTAPLVETAMSRSAARPGRVVNRCVEALASQGKSIIGANVLVVGVAYKSNVQDLRESPALEILSELDARGANVAFQDSLIAEATLENGKVLKTQSTGDTDGWDLVIAHTLHSDVDYTWLADVPAVIDATYKLNTLKNRIVL